MQTRASAPTVRHLNLLDYNTKSIVVLSKANTKKWKNSEILRSLNGVLWHLFHWQYTSSNLCSTYAKHVLNMFFNMRKKASIEHMVDKNLSKKKKNNQTCLTTLFFNKCSDFVLTCSQRLFKLDGRGHF